MLCLNQLIINYIYFKVNIIIFKKQIKDCWMYLSSFSKDFSILVSQKWWFIFSGNIIIRVGKWRIQPTFSITFFLQLYRYFSLIMMTISHRLCINKNLRIYYINNSIKKYFSLFFVPKQKIKYYIMYKLLFNNA